MDEITIGSLFTGYGGLDQAVSAVTGGRTIWTSDIGPGANKIIEHRYPDVPNLGDISAVDWSTVQRPDIITGGFPCQDVSAAGRRAGLAPGSRSGLWSMMCRAVDQLRPSLMVAENVRGLLSADGHADVEPCPWCLGNTGDEPALRALGGVLGDLADIGYDAAWHGLTASSVGAPHGRFRVFIIAWPTTNPDAFGRDGWARVIRPGRWGQPTNGGRAVVVDAVDDDSDGWSGIGEFHPATTSNPVSGGWERRGADGITRSSDAATRGSESVTTDPNSDGRTQFGRVEPVERDTHGCDRSDGPGDPGEPATQWGQFGPAIRRWEQLTRPAPGPTEAGPKGGQRLSPRFVEWMMGLPDGWVTDPVIGLTRNEQLKALGNGVVPAQAAQALRILLPIIPA